MKKTLAKKMKNSSKAIHYFSGENLTCGMIVVDPSGVILEHKNCPC